MHWDDVRLFLALARSKSLGAAATGLAVDRTTVGRRLDAFEKSVGSKLFVRGRDGLRPTASAERLRPYAERMETDAAALTHAAAATESRVSGVVRIATTEALAVFMVQEGLLALREEHPDLVIDLLGGNRPLDLGRGEADIALRLVKPTEATLRVRGIARFPIALFASHAYARTRGLPKTPAALAGHDVVVPSGELERLPEAQWLSSRRGVRVVFRSSSMPALVAAASRGAGLVALTDPWGTREPDLERAFVIEALPRRPIWLVTHPEADTRPAVRVVADRIAAHLRR